MAEEGTLLFYDKHKLFDSGYLNDSTIEFDPFELRNDGINPLMIDDEMCEGIRGELYKLTFSDKHNAIKSFENKWHPKIGNSLSNLLCVKIHSSLRKM